MFIRNRIFAELYRIALFNDTNPQNHICYMTNIDNENNRWCKLVPSEFDLPIIKTCVSINESLPLLTDVTDISEWIDQLISSTNCSYFLFSSIKESQKRILTLVQSIFLVILFLPFLFHLSLILIHYCFVFF